MRLVLLAFALALCTPMAAHAQDAQGPEHACVTIENDAQRLACYDAANGRTPRAEPALAHERSLMPSLPNLSSYTPPPPRELEVARVVRRAGGDVSIIMTNHEIWTPTTSLRRPPQVGEHVVIEAGAVGYYVLRPANGAAFQVRRQD
ncbi:MAG TPA: hypothetical protein VG943_08160 [Caulobacterales bacterium]|nr:hypothetical protein [Caulobacterales bacterium]